MRRALRHAFTACAALSLLICVAVCVLWVRSYFVCDALADGWVNDPPTSGTFIQALSNRGAMMLRWFDVRVRGAAPAGYSVGDGMHLDVGAHGGRHWTTTRRSTGRCRGFITRWGFITKTPRHRR